MNVSDMADRNIIDDGYIDELSSDGGAPLMALAYFFSDLVGFKKSF